jgi:hypothetical protein
MLRQNNNMNLWKNEQLEYFKKYLSMYTENSKEYNMILRGIKQLEKSLL